MMPEPSHQHDHFVQAVKANDIEGILNTISSDVFDVNFRDVTHDLETPLMRLCHSSITDEDMDTILQALDHKRSDVNLQDVVGRTLVMHACIALRHQIVLFSLAANCDTSLCDRMGRSAYHYAAESGSDWIMASLLKQPEALSCLKVLDFKGYSPTDLARHRKAHSVVKLISQAMSNEKGSNPKPLNPKPLQPAFMRSTNFNQSPTKKKQPVKFDTNYTEMEINLNNRRNPALDSSSASDRSEQINNGQISNGKNQMTNKECNDDNCEKDANEYNNNNNDIDNNNSENETNNNNNNKILVQKQTDLSPLKNYKQQTHSEELKSFTANTPIGLHKPRPLPRLSNQNKDNIVSSDGCDTSTNSDNNYSQNQNNIARNAVNMDTNYMASSLSPRKQNTKQNNIFTLRPAAANAPTTRARLQQQQASNAQEPQSDLSPTSTTTGGDDNNTVNSPNIKMESSRSLQRNKQTPIDLFLSTSNNNNNNDKPQTNQQHLAPVITPRKKPPNANGRKALEDLLSNSKQQYNEMKRKVTFDRGTTEGRNNSIQNTGMSETEPETTDQVAEGDNKITSTITEKKHDQTNNTPLIAPPQQTTGKAKNKPQIPLRFSTAGRRDLDAILSPLTAHKPLLQKRKETESNKPETAENLRESYTIKNKPGDKDNLFEEEIFLNTDINGALRLGPKKSKGERTGSRMTIRRSSLSLPDLRDMTGCLVTSRKSTPRSNLENMDTFDTGNSNKDYVNKKDKNDIDDDCDDEDDDDDKAEMEGRESDDSVSCDLEDESTSKRVSSNQRNNKISTTNNREDNSKGDNNEIPLPSIQLTTDSKSYLLSKGRTQQQPVLWS